VTFLRKKMHLIKEKYGTYDAARKFDCRDSDSLTLKNCSRVADAGAAPTHGAAKPREPTGRKTKGQYYPGPMFEEIETYFRYLHAVINCAISPVCTCPTINVCLFL
jgi:hypothetical protein